MTAARADEQRVEFAFSNYTRHYGKSPDHRRVYALGLSSMDASGWINGGAIFSNSFGQPSAYGFVGQRYDTASIVRDSYVQWTAGVMYGYLPPHDGDVPLNVKGFSPALVPTIGYQVDRTLAVQLSILGTAALMFRAVFALP